MPDKQDTTYLSMACYRGLFSRGKEKFESYFRQLVDPTGRR